MKNSQKVLAALATASQDTEQRQSTRLRVQSPTLVLDGERDSGDPGASERVVAGSERFTWWLI
ncbi:MAG TPA: hypothetical protein VIL77_09455, partial [Gaiellaceae bacterium]